MDTKNHLDKLPVADQMLIQESLELLLDEKLHPAAVGDIAPCVTTLLHGIEGHEADVERLADEVREVVGDGANSLSVAILSLVTALGTLLRFAADLDAGQFKDTDGSHKRRDAARISVALLVMVGAKTP